MAFVPVEDVAEFAVVQNLFGQNVINVFHVKKEGGWTNATLADMCVVFISAYNDDFALQQCVDLQYIIVRARDLTVEAGAVAEVNFPPGSGGDIAAESLPGNVAACAKHTTGLAGRSFRGRHFMAGLAPNNVDGNVMNQAYVDQWIARFDSLDARINTAGGTWGVVSRYSGYTQTPPKYKKVPTPRAAGIFTDIVNTSMDRPVDSQRKRLTGRGS